MLATVVKEGCYQTYPHANGFADGGQSIVLGRLNNGTASLWKVPPGSEKEFQICAFDISSERERLLWFDVARDANLLVTVAGGAVWLFDLNSPGNQKVVYQAQPPATISTQLPSITADGKRILIGLRQEEMHSVLSLDTASGEGHVLFEYPWFTNHFHFCPHDENWIGFCHEGPCEQIGKRVWGWHAEHAPRGRCCFDQHWGDPAHELCVGHERWAFHESKIAVVAYGVSSGGPRGIYEAGTDGTSRLISGGDRDLHLNVSRDGNWIVADTSGPHDLPGKGWEKAGGISDILLIDSRDGSRRWLARTRLQPRHPFHPHPVFSPDGRSVFYNEASADGHGGRVMRVANPGLENE